MSALRPQFTEKPGINIVAISINISTGSLLADIYIYTYLHVCILGLRARVSRN